MRGIGKLLSVLTLLKLLLSWATLVHGCPSICSCKWKGGKEWVECASRGLQGLPQGAREETQVLDLSGNQLLNLAADCFFVLRLVNLQRLYLARSRIRRIAARAFTGLQGLVELDLTENELDRVPTETFSSINNLMRLSLAGNPIDILSSHSFRSLNQLSHLDLSRCGIKRIEPEAFVDLHSLEWLKLNDNQLTTVPNSVLPLTINLHGLPLHGNPWLCDCRLILLRDWLKESQAQVPQEVESLCVKPERLKDKPIRSLKTQDLACAPKFQPTEQLDVYEGENATLHCEVEATPKPITAWLLNGEVLQPEPDAFKNSRIRYNFNEYSVDDRKSTNLEIFNVEPEDEGNYVCQAENAAGTSWANVTLRILRRESSSIEPPIDNTGTGYAAIIAAGALLGTLLALGCLFLSIFFYARHLHSQTKSNLKQLPPANSLVPPSILKKSTDNSFGKTLNSQIGVASALGTTGTIMCTTSACMDGVDDTTNNKYSDCNDLAYLQNQQAPQLRFIEPDLINEVPSENGYSTTDYRHSYQTCLESYSSCLDPDGYPLNFGLPKIGPTTAALQRNSANCETLPRIRQRQQQQQQQQMMLNDSANLPSMHYPCDANYHLVHANYPTNQIIEIGYAAVVPTPFMPSPPAAYRSEPTALSPRSLLHYKTQLESMGAVGGIVDKVDSPPLMVQPQPQHQREPPESVQHSESPDEGYVGDAMDV